MADDPDSDEVARTLTALERIVTKATEDYSRQTSFAAEMLKEAAKSFDQTLITLSAGAIALSVTYVTPGKEVRHFLTASWCGFAVALFITLISFKLVQVPLAQQRDLWTRASRRAEDGLSEVMTGNESRAIQTFAATPEELRLERSISTWQRSLFGVSILGLLAFVVGVTLLMIVALDPATKFGKP